MEQIEVPEKIYRIRIKGTASLLMHSPAGLGDKKSAKGVIPSPEEECKACLYTDGKGNIVVPARCVEGALTKAGASRKAPGQGKKSLKNYILAGLYVEPLEIPLIAGPYVIDRRRAVIQRSGVIRSRPRFDTWELEFNIRIIDEYLLGHGMDEVIKTVIQDAGKLVGLLDFRPRFGLFRVTEFEEVKRKAD